MGTAKQLFSAVNKAIQADMREQRMINADMKAVDESLGLAYSSSNYATRISRMQVAINRLDMMLEKYPGSPDVKLWRNQRNALQGKFPEFFVDNLSAFIRNDLEKIKKTKSREARYKRAQKLKNALAEYSGQCPQADLWLLEQIKLLEKSFPPDAESPVADIAIPTDWSGDTSETGLAQSSTPERPIKKPVSFFGKLGIWFLFACCFSPMYIKEKPMSSLLGLAGSIACAWLLVKWINRRRMKYS